MDLISRKAAIDALNMNGCCGMGITYLLDCDSVPAVPLDKLCEWLERYAMMNCDGCREGFGSCEDEENQEVSVCNSRERWKAMLTKWMEEQDAKEKT